MLHYLRCTYIPSILSLNVHMQHNSHNVLGESEESCDTEIMKRSESFNTGPKTLSYKEPGPQTAELDWEQGDRCRSRAKSRERFYVTYGKS